MPLDSASADVVICIWKTPEIIGENLLGEIHRVLKPGGKLLMQTSYSSSNNMDKVKVYTLDSCLPILVHVGIIF